MTAPALREAAREDTVVIIPLGATEQHGPHLPTQVDWRLAYEVSLRAARLMHGRQRALVTPAIPFGMSEHHMSLGGTLTLNFTTMSAVVGCIVRSAARHGFKRIFVLNGHGGNIAALETIITELTIELKLPLACGTYWQIAIDSIRKIMEKQTLLLHACEAETSMMMVVAPDCVRKDKMAEAHGANLTAATALARPLHTWLSFADLTPSGVAGDARKSTAAKGEKLFEMAAQSIAERLIKGEPWA